MQALPDIMNSSAIAHDYCAFSKRCHELQAPVFVMDHNKIDLVVLSFDAYQKLISKGMEPNPAQNEVDLEALAKSGEIEKIFHELEKFR